MIKNKLVVGLMSTIILETPVMAAKVPCDIAVDGEVLYELNAEGYADHIDIHSIDNRTMIPIRIVSENLGATVNWDTKTSKYTIQGTNIKTNQPTVINGEANSPNVLVNGEPALLDMESFDVVAKVIDGKTYVPLRFFAETLGYEVEADMGYAGIRMIYLDSPNAPERAPMRTGEGVKYKVGMGEREFNKILKERIKGMTVYENEYGSQAQFTLEGSTGKFILFSETSPYSSHDKGFVFKMVVPWGWNNPNKNQSSNILAENAQVMRATREIFSALTVEGDRVFAELDNAIIAEENYDKHTVTTKDGRTFQFTGEGGMTIIRIK